jgi:hypothetical protein
MTYGADRIHVDDDLGETCAVHEEQCTNKQVQHLQSAQARPLVGFYCDTAHGHDDTRQYVCKREPNTRADETETNRTGVKNNSSASGADLRADVIGGYVVGHRSIGLVTSVFFATVCTVAVTGMRK